MISSIVVSPFWSASPAVHAEGGVLATAMFTVVISSACRAANTFLNYYACSPDNRRACSTIASLNHIPFWRRVAITVPTDDK